MIHLHNLKIPPAFFKYILSSNRPGSSDNPGPEDEWIFSKLGMKLHLDSLHIQPENLTGFFQNPARKFTRIFLKIESENPTGFATYSALESTWI